MLLYLGKVKARTRHAAVTIACQRWPDRMDWSKPSGGFVVEQSKGKAQ
jgi:hypothetical protein